MRTQVILDNTCRALELYHEDLGTYPSSTQGLIELVSPSMGEADQPGYLKRVPRDGWGRVLHYRGPTEHSPYQVWSLGADDEEGGTDSATDLHSFSECVNGRADS